MAWVAAGVGIATFVVGIALLVLVFTWARDTFAGIDDSFAAVKSSPPVAGPPPPALPAATGPSAKPAGPGSGPANAAATMRDAAKGPPTVEGRPDGPGLGAVAATIAIKLLGLLVLGSLAGMVAGRGANMVGAALRPPPMGA
jgi:hypothetical protein